MDASEDSEQTRSINHSKYVIIKECMYQMWTISL